MMKSFLNELVEGRDLSEKEAHDAMSQIMSGRVSEVQIAAFLVAMRMKGETVDEITGCARAMREAATCVDIGEVPAVDTCGTGGDTKGTFNVSTAAAIVAAAAGVPVAKHGNRSVSSASGSADVLRELGVDIEAPPKVVEECIKTEGIGFLFAPKLHGAMKHAIGPRRELGVRTVFNLLGPLTNPAGVKRQIIGLYSLDLLESIAGVLRNLGSVRAMVVNSSDGLDEISSCAPTSVAELHEDGRIELYSIRPQDFGITPGRIEELQVESATHSAEFIKTALSGHKCPQRDIIALNAGAAIYVGAGADSLSGGVKKAVDAIETGRAESKLEEWREAASA